MFGEFLNIFEEIDENESKIAFQMQFGIILGIFLLDWASRSDRTAEEIRYSVYIMFLNSAIFHLIPLIPCVIVSVFAIDTIFNSLEERKKLFFSP